MANDFYVVPGVAGERVLVNFSALERSTNKKNELGVYRVDDGAGRVAGLLPADDGYEAAALARGRTVFTPNKGVGAQRNLTFKAGDRLALYLVQNNTTEGAIHLNPASTPAQAPHDFFSVNGAGPDDFDHVKSKTAGDKSRTFLFEDSIGGGDKDFNDAVVRISAIRTFLRVPGSGSQKTSVTFTLTERQAATRSQFAMFRVDNSKGAIGNLLPGDKGYAEAALSSDRRRTIFDGSEKIGSTQTFNLKGGSYFGLYLLPGSTATKFLKENPQNKANGRPVVYFPSPKLNPDGFAHFKWHGQSKVKVEDLFGGGDRDFNDLVATINFGKPSPPTPNPQGTKPPVIAAKLVDAAGNPDADGITRDPRISGTVTDPDSPIAAFLAGFDNTSVSQFVNVLPDRQSSGSFVFNRQRLDEINGSPLPDGPHRLRLKARDASGNESGIFDVLFVLDTLPPALTLDLHHDFDTDALGDRTTSLSPVTLVGRTEPNLTVTLVQTGATTVADASGDFSFSSVPLQPDSNPYTVTATDAVGNVGSQSEIFILADTQFDESLAGWIVTQDGGSPDGRGDVSVQQDGAVLVEGDSFLMGLERVFTIPEGAMALQFSYQQLVFDTADTSFINDAFEAALVDDQGVSLVPTYAPGRDAFFNVTEGLAAVMASGVTLDGGTVTVSLGGVIAGTQARLILRLVNNDDDTSTSVRITAAAIPGAVQSVEAPSNTKFFVADNQIAEVFGYSPAGSGTQTFVSAATGSDIKGIASSAAGDTLWTIDATTHSVAIYGSNGTRLGTWKAEQLQNPTGIATNGTDVWVVDANSKQIHLYAGAASRRSGQQSPTSSFALDAANNSPSDLVTDGTTIWVSDDTADKVFVYNLSGTLLGSWLLDATNADASGITIDPTGATNDLWTVDRVDRTVYRYANAQSFTSGDQDAADAFALAAGNVAPEGIADPPEEFARIKFHKNQFGIRPESYQVIATPVVIDVNGDQIADVIFSTYDAADFVNYRQNGLLRAISGSDGRELWTVTDPRYELRAEGGLAVGDIDNDGLPEIIAVHESHAIIAFEHDGTFKWLSPIVTGAGGPFGPVGFGAPSLADLDADGTPEIIIGASALNADGTIRWEGLLKGGLGTGQAYGSPLSIVAELDLDGVPEVVAGKTAYRSNGEVYWNADIPDGLPAIANLDGDAFPEIVVVSNGKLYILEHDGALKQTAINIPGGGLGGPPTIADVDGDGLPEIGVAGNSRYVVFEHYCTVKWQVETKDGSSQTTGSTVFDLDSDGKAEIIYGDEAFLRIYDGATGAVLYSVPKSSGTLFEMPIVVDLEGDGHAEIIAVANSHPTLGPEYGIFVIEGASNDWAATRQIWNQHSYHITNINDDGTIPAVELNSWELYNNYRRNRQTTGTQIFPPSISAFAPTDNIAAGSVLVLSGQALADGKLAGGSANRIVAVEVNGRAVDVLDVNGQFFAQVEVQLGENTFMFTATDAAGQTAATSVIIRGTQSTSDIDFSRYANITGSFSGVYGRTSFRNETNSLFVELATRNDGAFETNVPLLVGIKNLSDPNVSVVGADGVTPDGIPYYDFSRFVQSGRLAPGELTQSPVIAFHAPGRRQFTYDLVFYGKLNEAPIITSVPDIEALTDTTYSYDVNAIDPDNDTLVYRLVESPATMQIDGATGLITWTPAANDKGNHTIVVEAADGRGGMAEQRYVLSVIEAPPNRPPVITSVPETMAEVAIVLGEEEELVDLSTWQPFTFVGADGGDDANWIVDASGTFVEQRNNAHASVFLSDFEVDQETIRGSFRVNDTGLAGGTDNDFVGFVFAHRDTGEFYLFDWKAEDQTEDGAVGLRGMTVKVVDVEEPYSRYDFWNTNGNGARVKTLYHNDIGWANFADYRFQLDFASGSFVIKVWQLSNTGEESLLADIALADETYTSGKFGFYNYSQGEVQYRGFTRTALTSQTYRYQVEAVDPDQDLLTYALVTKPDGMAINPQTGLISWGPTASQVGDHTVKVEVTDGRGGAATQEFIVCVEPDPLNHAPIIISEPRTILPLSEFVAGDLSDQLFTVPGAPGESVVATFTYTFKHGIYANGFGIYRVEDALGRVNGLLPGQPGYSQAALSEANSSVVFARDEGPFATRTFTFQAGERYGFYMLQNSTIAELRANNPSNDIAGSPLAFFSFPAGNPDGGFDHLRAGVQTDAGLTQFAWEDYSYGGDQSFNDLVFTVDLELLPGARKEYRYAVSALDADHDNLTYSLVVGPSEAMIDPTTGIVSWLAERGSHPFTVRVEDGRGGFDEQSFTVEVVDGNGEIRGTKFNDADQDGHQDGTLFDINLIVNGDAEMGVGAAVYGNVRPPPGWTTNNDFTAVQYAAAIPQVYTFATDPGPVERGNNFFSGGPTNGSGSASQVIDVTAAAAEIDNGLVTYDLSGFLGGWLAEGDNAVVLATFVDHSGNQLGVSQIGPVTPVDRNNVTGLFFRSTSGTIPSGTRTINVEIRSERVDATSTDGYADNISLILHGPAEPGVQGWTIYLDQNNNGRRDAGELSTVTDASGNYAFTGLPPGTYIVREELQHGWRQTYPTTSTSVEALYAVGSGIVDGSSNIYRIDNYETTSPVAIPIGESSVQLIDLAINPTTGLAFAVSFTNLYAINLASGHATLIGSTGVSGLNALEFSPDGSTFYTMSGASTRLYSLDINTGVASEVFDVGHSSGGDLAFDTDGLLYLTTGSSLVRIDLSTRAAQLIGSHGVTQMAGLSFVDGRLLASQGTDSSNTALLYSIDKLTGLATLISSISGATTFGAWGLSFYSWSSSVIEGHLVQIYGNETVSDVDFGNTQLNSGPNQNPNFASSPPTSTTFGELFRYDPVAKDPDNDPLEFALLSGPEGLTINPQTGTVVWQPREAQIGEHRALLRVQDGRGGIAFQDFTLAVVAPNTAPVFTSQPAVQAAVGRPFVYDILVQDADGDSVTVSLEAGSVGSLVANEVRGPQGELLQTLYRFEWTPTAADLTAGSRTIRLVASDGRPAGSTTQQFVVQVASTLSNHVPVIESAPRTLARPGVKYLYAVRATDAEADRLTFALTAKPTSMEISEDGVISWMPPLGLTTPQPVRLVVSDGQGGEAVQEFTLTITSQDDNHGPQIISNPRLVAVQGAPYEYNAKASDADGDPVEWFLDAAPIGMSIDSATGAIRWTPRHDQTGPQGVVLRAQDLFGATTVQSFTIDVRCVNTPPLIVSTPPTEALVGEVYFYGVRATDPDDDRVTYKLDAAPSGMSISPTGLIRWTPQAGDTGQTRTVVVRAENDDGAFAIQEFNVVVSAATNTNRAPTITSTPVFGVTLGDQYRYQVAATDPNGDTLTYSLVVKPVGMEIDPNTGEITWTPTSDGVEPVVVKVTDPDGASANQGFAVNVRVNSAPQIQSTAVTTVTAGGTYRYSVRATDSDGDPLVYELVNAPAGMSIDNLGRILWSVPVAAAPANVTVKVSDPRKAFDEQSFTITPAPDTEAPRVTIQITASVTTFSGDATIDLGAQATIRVIASDNVGVASMSLEVDGMQVALDADGRAIVPAALLGDLKLVAKATDAAGNVGEAARILRVSEPARNNQPRLNDPTLPPRGPIDSTDNNAPTVEITSPSFNSSVTNLTPIVGTIDDPENNLWYWRVYSARIDQIDLANINLSDPDLQVISQGTSEIHAAEIAKFDPSVLSNDPYVILVVAFDTNGLGTVTPTLVTVEGNVKLGQFRLEFTDLSIPLAGIPITITRIYDTHDANQQGDFSYGWTLGVRDARIVEVGAIGASNFNPGGSTFVPDKTKVYLNSPSGQRIGFTYKERLKTGTLFGAIYEGYFVADPGVTEKFTIDDPQVFRGGLLGALGEEGINPDIYTLITADGTKYRYNQFTGLQTITDTAGNALEFRDDGIYRGSERVVTFDRDHRNRITKISYAGTGDNGQPETHSISYKYNASGDLVEFKDQVQLATTYGYHPARPHYLNEIHDPLGRRAAKTEYDDQGRILRVIDAAGNVVEYDHSQEGFERVRDANGNWTSLKYDQFGNVVEERKGEHTVTLPGGGTATVYDSIVRTQYIHERDGINSPNRDKEWKVTQVFLDAQGNVVKETTTEYDYDLRGNVTKVIDAFGTRESSYDQFGNVKHVKDELGRETFFEYDGQGNLKKVVNAVGDSSQITNDSQKRPKTYTDFRGFTTTFVYQGGESQPQEIYNPDHTDAVPSVRKFEYNAFGQVTKSIDEEGIVTEYRYDSAGRKIFERLGQDAPIEYEYQGQLQIKRIVRRSLVEPGKTDIVTESGYYDNDLLKFEIDALGAVTGYEYDPNGNRTFLGRWNTKADYDADMQATMTNSSIYAGRYPRATFEHVFVYDRLGRLDYELDDVQLDLAEKTPGYELIKLDYDYDSAGNRTQTIDRNGRVRAFEYDDRNRLIGEIWYADDADTSPDRSFVWVYCSCGNISEAVEYAGAPGTSEILSKYTYTYDTLGRMISVDNADTKDMPHVVLNYEYDASGNRIHVRDNLGVAVNSTYDNRNRLDTRAWDNLAGIAPENAVDEVMVDYDYYRNGAEKTLTRFDVNETSGANTLVGRTSYGNLDLSGRVRNISHRNAAGSILADYIYEFDKLGLVQGIDYTNQNSEHDFSVDYTYDDFGQLTDADYSDATIAKGVYTDELYRYDKNGNRTNSHLHGTDYFTGTGNRLLSDGTFAYAYDNEGNLIRKTDISTGEVTVFEYDHRNLMTRATHYSQAPESGGIILAESTNRYDIDGRRIAFSTDEDGAGPALPHETRVIHNGDDVWGDYDIAGRVAVRYILGNRTDQMIAKFETINSVSWYLSDGQGTLSNIISMNDGTVDTRAVDMFGNPMTANALRDRFLFAGRELEPFQIGYYVRARHLDPLRGRFYQQDPLGFDAIDKNLFRYGLNSPMNYADPFGLDIIGYNIQAKNSVERAPSVGEIGLCVARSILVVALSIAQPLVKLAKTPNQVTTIQLPNTGISLSDIEIILKAIEKLAGSSKCKVQLKGGRRGPPGPGGFPPYKPHTPPNPGPYRHRF